MSELRWTPQQARAITASGSTLLEANAGTGKTATVIGKIQWLLGLALPADREGTKLTPCAEPCELHEIAAITFTEKAAYDLKRKLREVIEESERAEELRWQIDRASIGTIHSFCAELLRDHALRLGIDPTFGVLDSRESWAAQDDIIREVIYEAREVEDRGTSELLRVHKLSGWQHTNGAIDHVRKLMSDLRWHRDRYVAWQRDGQLDRQALQALAGVWDDDTDEAALSHCDALLRLASRVLERWEKHLASENVRDFDSLILDVRRLLIGDDGAAALESIRRRYRILVIDEFQDTDFAQRDIAFAIAGLDRGRALPRPQLFLVGDPKQSIYRFRGADISVWNEVQKVVGSHGEVMQLSENFRCAPPIIDLVNDVSAAAMAEVGVALEDESPASVIAYSELVAARADTPAARLEWLVAEKTAGKGKNDPQAEAEQVAARIEEMVGVETVVGGGAEAERPIAYRDIAVLYRSRAALPYFEAALGRRSIPHTIAGAPHLGDRQEILDLLNALRLIFATRTTIFGPSGSCARLSCACATRSSLISGSKRKGPICCANVSSTCGRGSGTRRRSTVSSAPSSGGPWSVACGPYGRRVPWYTGRRSTRCCRACSTTLATVCTCICAGVARSSWPTFRASFSSPRHTEISTLAHSSRCGTAGTNRTTACPRHRSTATRTTSLR